MYVGSVALAAVVWISGTAWATSCVDDLRATLQNYARQSDLQIILQHHDLFKVTNEIPF